MLAVWNPSRLTRPERFAPERLRRERRLRTVAVVALAALSFVLGAINRDGQLVAVGVTALVGGLPLIWLWYAWQTKAGELLARKRAGG